MRSRIVARIVALTTAAACASTATQGNSSSAPGRAATVITAAEIAQANVTNAYEAVERLRPQFFRPRGNTSTRELQADPTGARALPVVYVDDTRFGEIESMRDVGVAEIKEIRFVSAADATQRWGTGHPHGAIQIVRGAR